MSNSWNTIVPDIDAEKALRILFRNQTDAPAVILPGSWSKENALTFASAVDFVRCAEYSGFQGGMMDKNHTMLKYRQPQLEISINLYQL